MRSYTGQELTPEEVEYLMDCASTAPSAGNMQAWDVVLVTDEQQKERLSAAALEQPHVRAAAALLVVTANYVRSMSRYGERGILYAIQDATIACTYMMLAAHAAGLVTCWVGAFEEEEVKQLLRLPVHVRPVAILCVGKGIPPTVHTGRMSPAEHIHEDRW
ncbi:nitroreductase [Methanolinea mesophila]|nr:nitroreductase [Methanolinea mesophila]